MEALRERDHVALATLMEFQPEGLDEQPQGGADAGPPA